MIKCIQIENFKSLKCVTIPMTKMNLYFGMNSMGKSSVLQVLLLLRQSYWLNNGKCISALRTNGPLIQLGTNKDVFCETADTNYLRVYIRNSNNPCRDFEFIYEPNQLSETDEIFKVDPIEENPYLEPLFNNGFRYLSAEHIGPKKSYSTENWYKNPINEFGNLGEFAVPFLAKHGDRYTVHSALCHKNGKTNKLIDQVTAWMAEISPGIHLSTELNAFEERAKLNISYYAEKLRTNEYTPVNIGFGISYVLPLIIELLLSDENSLLLIENPESHLHPKGQSAMGKLLAIAANNGAQIICESHSDHIINAIRVAVKNNILSHDELTIMYFDKNSNQETQVYLIETDKYGNLSDYPEGLLDEWGILMAELL